MAEHDSQIELSIDLGNDENDAAFQPLLSSLPLEAVVTQTLHKAGITQPVMLTVLITSDETIRNLNKQYRGQDKPTDVLSFPLLDKPIVSAPADQLWMLPDALSGEGSHTKQVFVTPAELTMNLGDIVISWPAVVRQAAEARHESAYELLYLLSHGVLHLVGYDDQTEAGYQAMLRIQQAVMIAIEQKA
ncbi:MAG TPA: rRNA maturation RNase YbeY [Ktedonobacteraceae bacterium]